MKNFEWILELLLGASIIVNIGQYIQSRKTATGITKVAGLAIAQRNLTIQMARQREEAIFSIMENTSEKLKESQGWSPLDDARYVADKTWADWQDMCVKAIDKQIEQVYKGAKNECGVSSESTDTTR